MANNLSDYTENELCKWLTGQTNGLGTAPTPYIRLWTVAPGEDGTGGTEVSGGSYAAVNSAGKWGAPSGGVVSNNADITFPTATASWGTVVALTIEDAASAGNQLLVANLTASKSVASGDTFRFASGDLTITAT